MTKLNEMTQIDEDAENSIGARIKRVLLPAFCFALGFGMFAGAIGGFAIPTMRDGFHWFGLAIAGPIALVGLVVIIATFRKWPTLQIDEPVTPRTRRQGLAMVALVVVSGLLPLLFLVDHGEGDGAAVELYSNNPLPSGMAVSAAIIWLVCIPILSAFTRRTMDEVDLGLMKFGESVGFRFFGTIAPAWWLGFRGGVLPQPDVMILFVATLAVAFSANMFRRL